MILAVLGGCGTAYELIWARWLGLICGTSGPAQATAVATMFLGLAAGYRWGDALAGRTAPARTARALAAVLAAVAALSAVIPALLPGIATLGIRLESALPHGLGRTAVCALVLLAPAALLGAAWPLALAPAADRAPVALAAPYAWLAVGSAAGPIVTAFVLLPAAGLQTTVWCISGAMLVAAAIAFRPAPEPVPDRAVTAPPEDAVVPLALGFILGFLSLAFQTALTRELVLTVTRSSVYGFATVLGAYLAGIAAGAGWAARRPVPSRTAALTRLAAVGLAAWTYAMATAWWDRLLPLMVAFWQRSPSFGVRATVDAVAIALALFPLTAAFGLALPAAAATGPCRPGSLFAANAAGAAAGALFTGWVLIPAAGLAGAFKVLGGLALAFAAALRWAMRPSDRIWIAGALPVALALGAVARTPDPVIMNAGLAARPLSGVFDDARAGRVSIPLERDGLSGRIAVWFRRPNQYSFRIDGVPNASLSAEDLLTQLALAHLPALVHPRPRQSLVIGLGIGTTAGSLILHPEVESVDVAEIEPAQRAVADFFRAFNGDLLRHPRVRLRLDDARHFLLTHPGGYDLVSSDPADLFVSGMANLYTREFYALVRSRLAPGGVFVQWLHYQQLGADDLRGAARTFQEVFPHASFWLHQDGDAFLLATPGPLALDWSAWERRLAWPALSADLARARVSPPRALLGLFLWDAADLARFSGTGRRCTDDDPYLEFTTPREVFSPGATGRLALTMKRFGPLAPAPVSRESAARRVLLGGYALARGSLARARAEFTRALVLSPGSAAARRGLAAVADAEAPVEHAHAVEENTGRR